MWLIQQANRILASKNGRFRKRKGKRKKNQLHGVNWF